MALIEVLGAVAEKTAEVAARTVETAGKAIEKTGETVEKSAEIAEKTASDVEHLSKNISELAKSPLEVSLERAFLYSKLEEVKQNTPEQLEASMDENLKKLEDSELGADCEQIDFREGLTDEEKTRLREETGWSDKIIDSLVSLEEAEIYKNAGLIEAEIGGKPCLIRPDIDWDQKDQFGRTNAERAKQGLAPIDSNGQPLELHHIGQRNDSPLAELTMPEHRGKGNDTILHDKSIESEIDRSSFGIERAQHWKERLAAEGVKINE